MLRRQYAFFRYPTLGSSSQFPTGDTILASSYNADRENAGPWFSSWSRKTLSSCLGLTLYHLKSKCLSVGSYISFWLVCGVGHFFLKVHVFFLMYNFLCSLCTINSESTICILIHTLSVRGLPARSQYRTHPDAKSSAQKRFIAVERQGRGCEGRQPQEQRQQ